MNNTTINKYRVGVELMEFFLMSIGYEGSLYISDYIFKTFSNKYRSLTYNNKQYVITNLNKSIVMGIIFFSFLNITIKNPEFLTDYSANVNTKQQRSWRLLTMLYASTDLISLIRSPNMPFSTQLHHYGVLLALAIILLSKFNGPSLAKALAIYGSFSAGAGVVNTYLGTRKMVDPKSKRLWLLKKISLVTYILACSGNWTWQLNYLLIYLKAPYKLTTIFKFLVNTGLLYSWIQDDLKLMRHLLTN